MKNNFLDTFTKFLKQLNVPVTETGAISYLETHPDGGSMLAYSDALNHYKIENAAVRITEKDLVTLPTPFIAFSQTHGGTFSVVKDINENSIEWFDTQSGWIHDKLEEFTKSWSGVVLLAEKYEKSGEKDYKAKRNNEILQKARIPEAVTLLVICFLYFIASSNIPSYTIYLLLAIKAVGIVISTLLFVKSIDNANSLVNKLCNAGSKISCQSILDSPAAKITPWFSWSDAGFIYFFGSFFSLLLCIGNPEALKSYLSYQLMFSTGAVLFSSYSLYYQGLKAKMWCTLCLGVVATFILEAILIYFINADFTFEITTFSTIFIGFLIPIAFLLLFKNMAIKAQESKRLNIELHKLKANPHIFEALMASQKTMPEIPADMPVITIGNKNAENVLTMVSNPLCTPCAHMHARVEKLLEENDNIKCQLIFISNTHENDPGGKFVRKLFSLPTPLHHEALNSWYERNDKNFERWDVNYNDYEYHSENNKVPEFHNYWTNQAEIKGTPTLFYNNRLLPVMVKVEDLIIFSGSTSTYIK